ncbi:MAG: hypothetical protein QOH70_1372 [Blastocatellia bacterium]|jgi:hypothetical protein|nr:hypothetical protein [Blastocatellia bacterium]
MQFEEGLLPQERAAYIHGPHEIATSYGVTNLSFGNAREDLLVAEASAAERQDICSPPREP